MCKKELLGGGRDSGYLFKIKKKSIEVTHFNLLVYLTMTNKQTDLNLNNCIF